MLKGYIRWIAPLVVLTLIVAFMLVSTAFSAFAAAPTTTHHHPITTQSTATPSPGGETPDMYGYH
jgi:hypothetical protein